jgi:hypothetical protein
MRIPLILVVLLVAVEAFGQQPAKPQPSVLLHSDPIYIILGGTHGIPIYTLGGTGAIHGVVIAHNGQPAKGITVTALLLCPETCPALESSAVTDEAGEYRFEPVTFGKYDVFVGGLSDFVVGFPSKFAATPLSDQVELSPDDPEAEVGFEVCERVPHKNK